MPELMNKNHRTETDHGQKNIAECPHVANDKINHSRNTNNQQKNAKIILLSSISLGHQKISISK